jgi:hypothetical protein
LAPYFQKVVAGPLLKKWLERVDCREQKTIDFLVAVNQQVQQSINYSVRMEPGVQSCETTLQRGNYIGVTSTIDRVYWAAVSRCRPDTLGPGN